MQTLCINTKQQHKQHAANLVALPQSDDKLEFKQRRGHNSSLICTEPCVQGIIQYERWRQHHLGIYCSYGNQERHANMPYVEYRGKTTLNAKQMLNPYLISMLFLIFIVKRTKMSCPLNKHGDTKITLLNTALLTAIIIVKHCRHIYSERNLGNKITNMVRQ